MAIIADIRGTHGSGKSYLVRSLLKIGEWESIVGLGKASKKGPVKPRHLGFHSAKWNATIIGNYVEGMTSGGCDIIQDPEEVVRRIKLFSENSDYVILEGLVVAHAFTRYSILAQELTQAGHEYRFCFLKTPMSVCLKRVEKRNNESTSKTKKPFRPGCVGKEYKQIWETIRAKCYATGHSVVELDWVRPVAALLNNLGLKR